VYQAVQVQAFPTEQQPAVAQARNSRVNAGERRSLCKAENQDFADLVRKMQAQEETAASKGKAKAKPEAPEEQNPLYVAGLAMLLTDLSVEQGMVDTHDTSGVELTATGGTGFSDAELPDVTGLDAGEQGLLNTVVEATEEPATEENSLGAGLASIEGTPEEDVPGITNRLSEVQEKIAENIQAAAHGGEEELTDAGEQVKSETGKFHEIFATKLHEASSTTSGVQKQEPLAEEDPGELGKGAGSSGEEISSGVPKDTREVKREFSVKIAEDEGLDYHPAVEFSGGLNEGDTQTSNAVTSETSSIAQRIEVQEKVVKQVLSQAKIMVENGVAKVEMNLEPKELGKLELSLVIEKDVVTASFVAESKAVQSIIEANLSDLRTALQEAGLKANLLEVGVQTGNFGQQEETASAFKQSSSYVSPDYLPEETEEFQPTESWIWGRVDLRA